MFILGVGWYVVGRGGGRESFFGGSFFRFRRDLVFSWFYFVIII